MSADSSSSDRVSAIRVNCGSERGITAPGSVAEKHRRHRRAAGVLEHLQHGRGRVQIQSGRVGRVEVGAGRDGDLGRRSDAAGAAPKPQRHQAFVGMETEQVGHRLDQFGWAGHRDRGLFAGRHAVELGRAPDDPKPGRQEICGQPKPLSTTALEPWRSRPRAEGECAKAGSPASAARPGPSPSAVSSLRSASWRSRSPSGPGSAVSRRPVAMTRKNAAARSRATSKSPW